MAEKGHPATRRAVTGEEPYRRLAEVGKGVWLDGVNKWGARGQSDPILYENVGRSCDVPILYYQIPIVAVPYDRSSGYRRSLESYVMQMETEFHLHHPVYKSGLAACDNWIHALEGGAFGPLGLRYMAAVYSESKHLVSVYAERLVGEWGVNGLADVAELFAGIAKVYGCIEAALGQDRGEGGALLHRPITPEQVAAVIPLVREAKRMETEAVQAAKRLLNGLPKA